MTIKIPIPIFSQTLFVLVNPTYKEFIKHKVDELPEGSTARTYSHGVIVFYIPKKKITHGLIAHEVYHAVHFLCDFIGIKYSQDSEEVYAYLIHHVINELDKKLKKIK